MMQQRFMNILKANQHPTTITNSLTIQHGKGNNYHSFFKGVTNFKKDDWHTFYRTEDCTCIKGTAEVRDVFPYHITFAMTVHKALNGAMVFVVN